MTFTMSANALAGHAQMHLATSDGSAASTFATTEAITPAQNTSHADQRWHRPSSSAAVAVAIMPSTEIGSRSAISSGWPCAKATARGCRRPSSPALGEHRFDPGGPLILVGANLLDERGADPVQLLGRCVDEPDRLVPIRDMATPIAGAPSIPAVEDVTGYRQLPRA
jgi:hypothetical protein